MRNKSIFMILSVFWVSSMLFTSCKDIDLTGISSEVMIDESLIAPVGETSVTVDDLLLKMGDQDYINTVGNEIYFTAKDSIDYSFRDIKIEPKEPVAISVKPWEALMLPRYIPAETTIPTLSISPFIDLGVNNPSTPDEQIEMAEINSANLTLALGLTHVVSGGIDNKDVKITIEFPTGSVTKADGTPYVIGPITPSDNGVTKSIPLTNFIINTPAGATGIQVTIKIDAKTRAVSGVTVNNTTAFNCAIGFENIVFKTLWGHFLPSATAQDSLRINLDLPTALSGFDLKFTNPEAKIVVSNSIGVKLRFNVEYVKAYDKNDVEIAKANFVAGPDTYNSGDSHVFRLNKPTQPFASAATTITLDKDNGATNRLFASGKIPATLEYKFTSGVDSDPTLNFITSNSTIKANVDVRIPLLLDPGSSVEMTDSIKDIGVNLTSSMKDVTINTGTLILNITNSFPTAATVELINMKDEQGNEILKSLTKVYSIDAPAEVSADGSVTKTKIQQLQIELKDGQFDEFKKLKDLVFKITLGDKTSTKSMHFSKANFIKVKAGVFVKGTITGNIGTTKN